MVGWFPTVAAQSCAVAIGLLAFGYLLVDVAAGSRQLDTITRWALAFPAVVAYAFVLMVLHMASGGRMFSTPWLVRGVSLGVAVLLAVRKLMIRTQRAATPRTVGLAAGAIVLLGVLVWGLPVARVVPLAPPGSDTGWHMGWTSQLLNGETTPSALISGAVPNSYPWMFHGLAAFVADITPGERAYRALGPLQIAQIVGALCALFALGLRLGRSWAAGAGAALFGGIGAGLAFALSRGFDHVLNTPRTGGPRGTYNASFNNLAPPLPRDVAYTLFVAFLLLLVVGISRQDRPVMVTAGLLVGLIGLTSAEFFFVALGTSVVGIVLAPGPVRRWPSLGAVIAPAMLVYGVWFVPLMVSYWRLGGFVNTTVVRAIVLSPGAILMSWGLSTPFALYGAIRWVPRARQDPAQWILVAALVVSGAVVAEASLIPALLGEGFRVVGRASRYWPVLHLCVAIYAGLGAGVLLDRAIRASSFVAAGIALLLLTLAVPLPFAVSKDYPTHTARSPELGEALLGSHQNVLTDLALAGRGRCIVATPVLAFTAFSYTGYRLVAYQGSRGHSGNFARIRWRNIYEAIPPDGVRLADLDVLIGDGTDRATFRSLLQKYGVNLLVVPRDRAGAPVYRGLHELGSARSDRYSVFLITPCDH
jgi:hypothetical protein